MDEADLGNKHAALFRQNAIDAARNSKDNLALSVYINGEKCCVDCEEPIPAKRLLVNPDAVRCIACQILAEKKQRE